MRLKDLKQRIKMTSDAIKERKNARSQMNNVLGGKGFLPTKVSDVKKLMKS